MLAKFQIALISAIDWHKPSHSPELHSTCHFKISVKQDHMNTRFGPIDMSRFADSNIVAILLATFSTVFFHCPHRVKRVELVSSYE